MLLKQMFISRNYLRPLCLSMNVDFKNSIVSQWNSDVIQCCHRNSQFVFLDFNRFDTLVLFVVHCIPAQLCFAKSTPRIMFLLSSLHTMNSWATLFVPILSISLTVPMEPRSPPSAPITLSTSHCVSCTLSLRNVL